MKLSPRPSARSSSARTSRSSSATASSWRSFITLWSNSSRADQLALGDREAPFDLLRVVGAAADEPLAQRLLGRRDDEDLHRRGQRPAHLARALHLDLQHDRDAGSRAPLQLGAQRAVAATGVGGVLDERARLDLAVELLVAEEVVVDAVDLARPRLARRRRDGQLQLGDAREQAADQRPLADAGGPVMTKTRATRGRRRRAIAGAARRARRAAGARARRSSCSARCGTA